MNYFLSQFSPLLMCSLINLYDLRFNGGNAVTLVSGFLACSVLLVLLVALSIIFFKVYNLSRILNKESIQSFMLECPELTESLKET
jgi:glycerol-3-phosphate acyltransferase PlsY